MAAAGRRRQEPAQDHPVPARAHRRVLRPDRTRPRTRTACRATPLVSLGALTVAL